VAEIAARAGDRRFVPVAISPRTLEPALRRCYWPIHAAAARHGLPIAIHSAAFGTRANTGAGWASFYIEEHFAFSHAAQAALVNMLFEGVFDAFPTLKVVLVEGALPGCPPWPGGWTGGGSGTGPRCPMCVAVRRTTSATTSG
jgi:predicted TIM-barrel fold metal-dependent hydrolase